MTFKRFDMSEPVELTTNSESKLAKSLPEHFSEGQCSLCYRFTRKGTTKHHLIPRACHRNKWFRKRYSRPQMQQTIPVCWQCHSMIHKFVPNQKDLGRHFFTAELLAREPQMANYLEWIRGK